MIVTIEEGTCKKKYGYLVGLIKLWDLKVSDRVVMSIRETHYGNVELTVDYLGLSWSSVYGYSEIPEYIFTGKEVFIKWLHDRPFNIFNRAEMKRTQDRLDKELFCDS